VCISKNVDVIVENDVDNAKLLNLPIFPLVGARILDFPTRKSGFPGRESSWYKRLIESGNPEIKVLEPIIPDFPDH